MYLGVRTDRVGRTKVQKVSSKQNPGYLLYIGDYTKTTQLHRDYNKPIARIPFNQPGFHGMSRTGLYKDYKSPIIRVPINQPGWLMEWKGTRQGCLFHAAPVGNLFSGALGTTILAPSSCGGTIRTRRLVSEEERPRECERTEKGEVQQRAESQGRGK